MAYIIDDLQAGSTAVGAIDTTQRFPLGQVFSGTDSSLGVGTFVYLKGVASTAVGDAVTYNPSTGVTARAVAGARGPVAVATAANTSATNYALYQIGGRASVKTGTVAANTRPYVTATPGQLDDAVVSGDSIDGARIASTDSGGFASIDLVAPYMNGNG